MDAKEELRHHHEGCQPRLRGRSITCGHCHVLIARTDMTIAAIADALKEYGCA